MVRKINLYFFMLEELLFFCRKKSLKKFYHEWLGIPKKELIYILRNHNIDKIDKVIIIGAGAIPYTAIFFAKHFRKQVYALEKNRIISFACSILIRRLGIDNIKVIKESGQCYSYCCNSLVIISLHTISKQAVLERILSTCHDNIIVIRQPAKICSYYFESVLSPGLEHATIEHQQGLKSFVVSCC